MDDLIHWIQELKDELPDRDGDSYEKGYYDGYYRALVTIEGILKKRRKYGQGHGDSDVSRD